MSFNSITKHNQGEIEDRYECEKSLGRLGISYLDEALDGIFPDDLILLGAESGIGKTQLCCNIAMANIERGKRVHFLALEASEFEIERRLKYQMVAKEYFASVPRPHLGVKFNWRDWRRGRFKDELAQIELKVMCEFEERFGNMFVLYKNDKFDITDLIENVVGSSDESDMFLIDHAHYFDFDDDNENRSMKKLAKTVRNLAINHQKPIILVAHLRKRDRFNNELCPGRDEFHGSSDLTKIATRVVTMAPGEIVEGGYETFMRVAKDRSDSGTTRFIARMVYNPQRGNYESKYRLGPVKLSRDKGFSDVRSQDAPEWARSMVAPPVGIDGFGAAPRHWNDRD